MSPLNLLPGNSMRAQSTGPRSSIVCVISRSPCLVCMAYGAFEALGGSRAPQAITALSLRALVTAVLGQCVEDEHCDADVGQRPDRVVRHPRHRAQCADRRGEVTNPPRELR